jgi:hypothetical protein
MAYKSNSQPLRFSAWRPAMIMGCLSYAAAFHWAYVSWAVPIYAGTGLTYTPPALEVLLALYFLAVLPSFWLPLDLLRPTQFVYLIVYVAVYVPSIFVPTFVGLQQVHDTLAMSLVLCAGLAIVGSSYKFPTLRIGQSAIERRLFWILLYGVVLAVDVWIVVAFRGSLHFVGFEDVYTVRGAAAHLLESAGVLGYAMLWSSGALNPYLIASGVFENNKFRIGLGAAGQALIYAAAAHKAALVSILFIPVLAAFFQRKPRRLLLKFVLGAVVLLLVLTIGLQLNPSNVEIRWTGIVVVYRTLALPGLLTAQYQDFFSRSPHTWFSQYTPFKDLLSYPYGREIGYELGRYYYGQEDVQSNAHFWASDGIASAGIGGIFIASALCGFAFWVVDSLLFKYGTAFGAATLSFWALAISNTSVLTSISSQGLGMLILLYYFGPPPLTRPAKLRRSRKRSQFAGMVSLQNPRPQIGAAACAE